ncbi:bifunctional ADP-dependent NAD(P)H-hydrate dehydratase/NAD(P)H-hydrate epimerase [Candidatus Caldatribacterium saccharofermentans]|uniref:bifunctional ADP-dependent NAD(P)H-hydrate dehydratase/NAD(P)H-hydrate epimerase n=1 Tax=Candidatus Caldatribacterium saccharofermentans TaxID=1454753 RepID=UPI00037A4162
MIELVTAKTMQEREKSACERFGLRTLLLMENAGRAVASEVLSALRERPSLRRVAIVCGTGNNGGDGMVVARHLFVAHPESPPRVYLVGSPENLRGDAQYNYAVITELGLPVQVVSSSGDVRFEEDTLIVDALFGTGLAREVEGIHREVIRCINAAVRKFVVAVDVPSGVDASDGRVLGEAVQADLTVTFGFLKRGLVLYPGRAYAGRIKVYPIGIPLSFGEDEKADGYLVLPSDVRALLPRRSWSTHKISAGVVGVVAGSSAMLGAGILVAQGAYRGGAGMVVWPLPAELSLAVRTSLPEVVGVTLGSSAFPDWSYGEHDVEAILRGFEARKVSGVVVGPGLGMKEGLQRFLERFLELIPAKGVLDADALNIIAEHRERWEGKLAGWVVTPHVGEAARLLARPVQEVSEWKVQAARDIAAFFGCVVVLKGPGTLVVSPGGEIFVNSTGNELLATAGSGDVLAGLIGGLMAQGLDAVSSALCGVFLHGLSGDILRREGRTSIVAHEIAERLDAARKVVEDGTWEPSFLDGDFSGAPCP